MLIKRERKGSEWANEEQKSNIPCYTKKRMQDLAYITTEGSQLRINSPTENIIENFRPAVD